MFCPVMFSDKTYILLTWALTNVAFIQHTVERKRNTIKSHLCIGDNHLTCVPAGCESDVKWLEQRQQVRDDIYSTFFTVYRITRPGCQDDLPK